MTLYASSSRKLRLLERDDGLVFLVQYELRVNCSKRQLYKIYKLLLSKKTVHKQNSGLKIEWPWRRSCGRVSQKLRQSQSTRAINLLLWANLINSLNHFFHVGLFWNETYPEYHETTCIIDRENLLIKCLNQSQQCMQRIAILIWLYIVHGFMCQWRTQYTSMYFFQIVRF